MAAAVFLTHPQTRKGGGRRQRPISGKVSRKSGGGKERERHPIDYAVRLVRRKKVGEKK